MITHRYAKANHPDLEDIGYYDKKKPLCNLLYLDANNLYGWVRLFMLWYCTCESCFRLINSLAMVTI